jgi:hypothetical protein
VIVQGVILVGITLLALVPGQTRNPHATLMLIMPIYFAVVAGYVLWTFRRVRRASDAFREDPNVVWAGMAGVDRVDLVQANVVPAPPVGYGRRGTVVLITRSGLGFRPVKDRWGWRGTDLPVRRIDAVTFGTVLRGGQRWPAMRVLVGSAVISVTMSRISAELREAVASLPLATALIDSDEFDLRAESVGVGSETVALASQSRSRVGRWLFAVSTLMVQHPWRMTSIFVGTLLGGFFVFGVGLVVKQVVVQGLGVVAAFGMITLVSAVRIYRTLDEQRYRSRLEVAMDTQPRP